MGGKGSAGPLDGLKVVEFGVAMAGPFCAMLLADYGAGVVKVERVGEGDDSRGWPPYFAGALPYYFAAANRNKRSIALDLKSAKGRAIAWRLAAEADVLIDNYRVGALARAGLGYEALAAANPRLVYCSISGFGASGPRAEERANDLFMQAFAGSMSITGEPGGGPVKIGPSIADIGAGLFAAVGILMALEARHRSGRGQRVETSLLEGQLAMLAYHLTYYFASGRVPERRGSASQVNVPYQAFATADDWVVIAAFNEPTWRRFAAAVGHPAWADDPRFRSADRREASRELLVGMIGEALAQLPAAEWERRFKAAGVPCTRVNRIDQVVEDAQVRAREMIAELAVPGVGSVRMAGLPVKLAATPGRIAAPPPRLGQHTDEVLQELGFSGTEIAALAASGAVALDQGFRGTREALAEPQA